MSNKNDAVKMLVFIALATFLVGAVAATVIPAQQTDAQSQGRAPECPPQSPAGGGNPINQQGCGPNRY